MKLEQFSALLSALDNVQSGFVKDAAKWEQYGLGLVAGLVLSGAVSPALAGVYETALASARDACFNKNSHNSDEFFSDFRGKRAAFISGANNG